MITLVEWFPAVANTNFYLCFVGKYDICQYKSANITI